MTIGGRGASRSLNPLPGVLGWPGQARLEDVRYQVHCVPLSRATRAATAGRRATHATPRWPPDAMQRRCRRAFASTSMPFHALAAASFGNTARTASRRASTSSRDEPYRRRRTRAVRDCGALQPARHFAVHAYRVVHYQPSATMDANPVAQPCMLHCLTHCGTSEHQRLDTEEAGVLGQFDVQAPFQRAAVEQDGLLRQPLRGAPGCDRNARSYGCRHTPRQRAIETFRGLARNRRACARLQLERTRQRIAAGNTARGIQRHHGRPVVAFRPRKPRLQAASLAQSIQHRMSVAHAQHHAQFADRPLQYCRVRPRGGVVHSPRPAPPAAPPARHHRDPSRRWSARVPGRNRNIAPPTEWPCRRAPATARSRGRCP